MTASLLDIAIAFTLWASIGGLGLEHPPSAFVAPLGRRGLLARIVAFDVLAVPVATWLVVQVLAVPYPYAIGLILVGATSAGPLGLLAVQLAEGDVGLAIALVVVLEVANTLAIPIWAVVLLPRAASVPMAQIVAVLLAYVLAPLATGSLIRDRAPTLAGHLAPLARRASIAGLVLVVSLVVARDLPLLGAAVGAGVTTATVALIGFALAGGWLAAGSERSTRSAAALTTAQRGSSVALAIAVTAFRDLQEASLAVVVYGTISTILVPLAGLALRQRAVVERSETGLVDAPG